MAENKAVRLLDEVIYVVSGFQVAGFLQVVGCLWLAGDSECVDVVKWFYSGITAEPVGYQQQRGRFGATGGIHN